MPKYLVLLKVVDVTSW